MKSSTSSDIAKLWAKDVERSMLRPMPFRLPPPPPLTKWQKLRRALSLKRAYYSLGQRYTRYLMNKFGISEYDND